MKVKKLRNSAIIPTKAYEGDAGWDLYYDGTTSITINPHESHKFQTGIIAIIDKGYFGLVADKSGIADNQRLHVNAGIIDSTYRGEIIVLMVNRSNIDTTIYPKQKIAQLIIMPCDTDTTVEVLTDVPETKRGNGGFGSTGV